MFEAFARKLRNDIKNDFIESVVPKIKSDLVETLVPMVKGEVLSALEPKFNAIDKRFDRIEIEVRSTGITIEQMNRKIDVALEMREEVLEQRFRLEDHEKRIEIMRQKLSLALAALQSK